MTEQKERPVFLTVICILSYIGLGIAIISNLTGLLLSKGVEMASEFAEEGMDEALTEIESEAPALGSIMESIFGGAMKAMEHYTLITTVSLVCSLIALFGVIKMWQLKKLGFYLYAGAKVIIIILPIALIGGLLGGISLMGAIFPIAFIIMYGVNLKAMD